MPIARTLAQTSSEVHERIGRLFAAGRSAQANNSGSLAREKFLEAFYLSQSVDDEYQAVDAAHMLGQMREFRDHDRWDQKALALATSARDPRARRWVASLLESQGLYHLSLKHARKALEFFTQALQAREKQSYVEPLLRARALRAKALRELGLVNEALSENLALHGAWQGRSKVDADVCEAIGGCLQDLGRHQEAKYFAGLALETLQQDPKNLIAHVSRLQRLRDAL